MANIHDVTQVAAAELLTDQELIPDLDPVDLQTIARRAVTERAEASSPGAGP